MMMTPSTVELLVRYVKATESIALDLHRISVNTRHIALNTQRAGEMHIAEDEQLDRVIAR
jgi:hypothetical protein